MEVHLINKEPKFYLITNFYNVQVQAVKIERSVSEKPASVDHHSALTTDSIHCSVILAFMWQMLEE